MGKTENGYKETEIGVIPEEWEVLSIPDLLSDEKGAIKMGPFGSQIKKEDLTTEGVHLIGIENVLQKDFVKTGERYISHEKFESLKTNQVVPGDIVITTMGTVGYTGIIPNDIPTTIIDSHLIRLRVNDKVLDYFLARVIQDYELVQKQIKRMSQGGIMAGLNTGIIKQLKIPVPSKKEQIKISRILESLDKVIEKTEAVIKQTEEVKKGLMQQLLTKGVGHTKFKETKAGEIPVEWELLPVGSIAKLQGGYAFKSKDYIAEGIQLIRISNLFGKFLNLTKEPVYLPFSYKEAYEGYALNEGDLIISMTGTVGKEDYGHVVKIPRGSKSLLLNQRVGRFILQNRGVDRNFLYWFLSSRLFLDVIYSFGNGTKQANLSAKQIESVLIPLPPKEEQMKISRVLDSIDKKVEIEKEKLYQLEVVKKGLMQSLLTGKVRVKINEAEVTQV